MIDPFSFRLQSFDLHEQDRDNEDDDYEDDDYEEDDDLQDEYDDSCEEPSRLKRELQQLSEHFPLWIDDDYRFVIVQNVKLPPGYNREETELLIELPADYPYSPPGLGSSSIYVLSGLFFNGKPLRDYRVLKPKYPVPEPGSWAWLCYETLDWCVFTDDLIKLVELIRTDLTSPPTL